MKDDIQHIETTVQTSRLMEELGQVEYIFSDKTGTLTCNVMEFKNVCVFGESYGDNRDHDGPFVQKKLSNVDFKDKKFFEDIRRPDHAAHEILFLLSTCHTINIENKNGEMKYSASSPDELALCNFARLCGYEYIGTNQNEISVLYRKELSKHEEIRKYKILHVLEFNSDRKRMSVILEHDGKIILFCKGADSIIFKRARKDAYHKEIETHLENYSNKGLRTLLLSKKEINKEEFYTWNEKYMEASCAIRNREEAMSVLQEELEKDLVVIGATAIEDKLQDKVGDTIAILKEAGIKVWVLTGDKVETAINIGFSCKLLDKTQHIFTIDTQHAD